mgnify:FL=1
MKYYTFNKFKKKSGTLIPISLSKDIPFKTKRVFMIYGNKNFVRGNHAHKKCSQFLLPIFGKIRIDYFDKLRKNSVLLNSNKKKGILLKPLTWCKLTFLSKNSIILVFCDREYEYKDYIEKISDFKKILKIK